MPHRKHRGDSPGASAGDRSFGGRREQPIDVSAKAAKAPLKIVLKGDSQGSVEALQSALAELKQQGYLVEVIHSDLGPVNKSDLLMAMSGDRLVVGFQVGVQPKLELLAEQQGVEVRLYNVIYTLVRDLRDIMASSQAAPGPSEEILGKARIIALFKTGRKGIIIGCEVQEGKLLTGKPFRIISAMGPVHSGKIESMQIDNQPVKEAPSGRQVGIMIHNFKQARIGDLVECFQPTTAPKPSRWGPRGGVHTFVNGL
jgi:translation initiation factor IF-2